MKSVHRRKFGLLKLILLVCAVVAGVVVYRLVFSRPSFNADKIARAETEMWRAYYAKNELKLATELVSLFRNQFGLSLPAATRVGKLYAQAAMKFQAAPGNYDQVVLPDLIEAYRLLQQHTKASFNPETAARAELAWWVARRTQGQNSLEQVGRKIADLYAVLYGGNDPKLQNAALLRAKAAGLRDASGANPDWAQIEALLRESYSVLQNAR